MKKVLVVFVVLLVGCASGPYKQTNPIPPSQIRSKIGEIEHLYLDPSVTLKDLVKVYAETYEAIQTSTYKKQIMKEIYWPMRKNIADIWWSGGMVKAQDFMKGKKFSRSNPALIFATPPTLYGTFGDFVSVVFLNAYKDLLRIDYVGWAEYQFSLKDPVQRAQYFNSLKKTLKNSDVEKRNICFLIQRFVKTGEEEANEEYRRKARKKLQEAYQKGKITEAFYKKKLKQINRVKKIITIDEWCIVQCSEEVNLLRSFKKPCWSKEVFNYLNENVYRAF